LEKKWLEGSTGLKNDPQGRQVFLLAGTPLGKFLATLLIRVVVLIFRICVSLCENVSISITNMIIAKVCCFLIEGSKLL
jgi:hypothetical protein